MGVIQKQVDIAKEVDDVLALVVHLVKEIKSGKDIGQIVGGSVQPLIDAVNGVDQVSVELASHKKEVAAAVALRLSEVVDALLSPKA